MAGGSECSAGPSLGLGANGTASRDDRFVVDTTDTNLILAIDVLDDSTPGPITTLAGEPLVFAPDGLTIDEQGDIYIAMAGPAPSAS